MRGSVNLKRALFTFLCVITIIFSLCLFTANTTGEQQTIAIVSEKILIPGGQSVGVKMDVKGVLVVGLQEIKTADSSYANPGLEAGLELGDKILEVEGKKVYKASEVQSIINEIKGNIKLKVQRRERIINIEIIPVKSEEDNLYKIGVWVKDKTAGIGTLTFYDPETGSYGALGHGIADTETGTILQVAEGELVNSKVQSIKEGRAGEPGEIRGIFYEAEEPLGGIEKNTEYGIFGKTYLEPDKSIYSYPMVVGGKEQVKEGPAYILTTIDGDKVERYEILIKKVERQKSANTKSMVIQVTDKELLKKTGGIVQGMSGSPIVQNNRLIGAVTHVFVNNPEKGYGVFIEWMLEQQNLQ